MVPDLQHTFHLEGDADGHAEVQLAVQGGVAGQGAGADHAAAPGPGAHAVQLLEAQGAAGQLDAATAAAGGGSRGG